ncbi:hypothetical protein GY45DRAFT_1149933 [Cubamyces sp. BRFM 1775]|nr:hypothetical protein GY45DRAFT_1149933 [Cubamyces sp. BRFM 1775]
MASATSSFAYSHTSGTPFHSTMTGWNHSSLVSALGEPSSSRVAAAHEWHIPSDPLSDTTSASSSLPSPALSPTSPYASSSSSTASSPAPESAIVRRKKTTSRRGDKPPGHIPRPRNAFMIFRSAYCASVKESQVEHDHRMISKILGAVWRNLEVEKKEHYKKLAAEEKEAHRRLHPNYRFSPQQRTEKAKKRNVKRNGLTDKQRCAKVAKLLLEGKGGDALKAEVDKFDKSTEVKGAVIEDSSADYTTGVFDPRDWVPPVQSPSPSTASSPPSSSASPGTPAFRSPLLPPSVAQTSAIRSPLDIPNVAQLDMLSPLSPLGISPLEAQAQAPVLASVPLPQIGEQSALQLQGSFSSLYPSSSPSLSLEAPYPQPQPQGELRLSHLYTPRSAAIVVSEEDYTYASAPYVHQLSPALDAGLSATPYGSTQFVASQQPFALGYPDSGSSTPDLDGSWPSSQYATAHYSATATQYVTGGDPQHYQQSFVFPSASSCASEATHAGDASGMNMWTYGQSSGLEVPVQGEPQSAAGWMRY